MEHIKETERRKKQLDKQAAAENRAKAAYRTIVCQICSHLCASDFCLRSQMKGTQVNAMMEFSNSTVDLTCKKDNFEVYSVINMKPL